MKSSPACCMLLPTNHDRGTFEWSRVGRVSKRKTQVEATRKHKQGKGCVRIGGTGQILKEAKQPWAGGAHTQPYLVFETLDLVEAALLAIGVSAEDDLDFVACVSRRIRSSTRWKSPTQGTKINSYRLRTQRTGWTRRRVAVIALVRARVCGYLSLGVGG